MIQVKRSLKILRMFNLALFVPFVSAYRRSVWKRRAQETSENALFLKNKYGNMLNIYKEEPVDMKIANSKAESAQQHYDLYDEITRAFWLWKKWRVCSDYVIGQEFLQQPVRKRVLPTEQELTVSA